MPGVILLDFDELRTGAIDRQSICDDSSHHYIMYMYCSFQLSSYSRNGFTA